MSLLIAGAILFNTGVILAFVLLTDRQRQRLRTRLRRARGLPVVTPEAVAASKSQSPKRREAHGALQRLDHALTHAGLRLTVSEVLIQVSIAGLIIFALTALVLRVHPAFAALISIGVPLGILLIALKWARSRYLAAFTADLPEALDVFARGLRAGRPVVDSLGIVVQNAQGPLLREMSRCRDEIAVGMALHESLDRLAERVPTAETGFFSVSTALQSETGGNLIETMETLAEQLRERRKLRKKARALSAEARASAMILAALPFAISAALFVLNAEYLSPLWSDTRGRFMAIAALLSVGAGVGLMARMGKLNV